MSKERSVNHLLLSLVVSLYYYLHSRILLNELVGGHKPWMFAVEKMKPKKYLGGFEA